MAEGMSGGQKRKGVANYPSGANQRPTGVFSDFPNKGACQTRRATNHLVRKQGFFCHCATHYGRLSGIVATNFLPFIVCLLPSTFCQAEELPDPTRPPTMISIPTAAEGKNLPPGLQSVIISKSRRAAIIDGETVELRGKHGDATLIEVTESSVVLQGAQGRQVLTLFPDVKIMQKEIQATPKLPVKEGGVAQKNKPEARKEHK